MNGFMVRAIAGQHSDEWSLSDGYHVDIYFLIILPLFVIYWARLWLVLCEHEDGF